MIRIPVSCIINSPARCTGPPTPEEPNVTAPGRALAYSINSARFFTGSEGCTATMVGDVPNSVIEVKSLLMSKGSLP